MQRARNIFLSLCLAMSLSAHGYLLPQEDPAHNTQEPNKGRQTESPEQKVEEKVYAFRSICSVNDARLSQATPFRSGLNRIQSLMDLRNQDLAKRVQHLQSETAEKQQEILDNSWPNKGSELMELSVYLHNKMHHRNLLVEPNAQEVAALKSLYQLKQRIDLVIVKAMADAQAGKEAKSGIDNFDHYFKEMKRTNADLPQLPFPVTRTGQIDWQFILGNPHFFRHLEPMFQKGIKAEEQSLRESYHETNKWLARFNNRNTHLAKGNLFTWQLLKNDVLDKMDQKAATQWAAQRPPKSHQFSLPTTKESGVFEIVEHQHSQSRIKAHQAYCVSHRDQPKAIENLDTYIHYVLEHQKSAGLDVVGAPPAVIEQFLQLPLEEQETLLKALKGTKESGQLAKAKALIYNFDLESHLGFVFNKYDREKTIEPVVGGNEFRASKDLGQHLDAIERTLSLHGIHTPIALKSWRERVKKGDTKVRPAEKRVLRDWVFDQLKDIQLDGNHPVLSSLEKIEPSLLFAIASLKDRLDGRYEPSEDLKNSLFNLYNSPLGQASVVAGIRDGLAAQGVKIPDALNKLVESFKGRPTEFKESELQSLVQWISERGTEAAGKNQSVAYVYQYLLNAISGKFSRKLVAELDKRLQSPPNIQEVTLSLFEDKILAAHKASGAKVSTDSESVDAIEELFAELRARRRSPEEKQDDTVGHIASLMEEIEGSPLSAVTKNLLHDLKEKNRSQLEALKSKGAWVAHLKANSKKSPEDLLKYERARDELLKMVQPATLDPTLMELQHSEKEVHFAGRQRIENRHYGSQSSGGDRSRKKEWLNYTFEFAPETTKEAILLNQARSDAAYELLSKPSQYLEKKGVSLTPSEIVRVFQKHYKNRFGGDLNALLQRSHKGKMNQPISPSDLRQNPYLVQMQLDLLNQSLKIAPKLPELDPKAKDFQTAQTKQESLLSQSNIQSLQKEENWANLSTDEMKRYQDYWSLRLEFLSQRIPQLTELLNSHLITNPDKEKQDKFWTELETLVASMNVEKSLISGHLATNLAAMNMNKKDREARFKGLLRRDPELMPSVGFTQNWDKLSKMAPEDRRKFLQGLPHHKLQSMLNLLKRESKTRSPYSEHSLQYIVDNNLDLTGTELETTELEKTIQMWVETQNKAREKGKAPEKVSIELDELKSSEEKIRAYARIIQHTMGSKLMTDLDLGSLSYRDKKRLLDFAEREYHNREHLSDYHLRMEMGDQEFVQRRKDELKMAKEQINELLKKEAERMQKVQAVRETLEKDKAKTPESQKSRDVRALIEQNLLIKDDGSLSYPIDGLDPDTRQLALNHIIEWQTHRNLGNQKQQALAGGYIDDFAAGFPANAKELNYAGLAQVSRFLDKYEAISHGHKSVDRPEILQRQKTWLDANREELKKRSYLQHNPDDLIGDVQSAHRLASSETRANIRKITPSGSRVKSKDFQSHLYRELCELSTDEVLDIYYELTKGQSRTLTYTEVDEKELASQPEIGRNEAVLRAVRDRLRLPPSWFREIALRIEQSPKSEPNVWNDRYSDQIRELARDTDDRELLNEWGRQGGQCAFQSAKKLGNDRDPHSVLYFAKHLNPILKAIGDSNQLLSLDEKGVYDYIASVSHFTDLPIDKIIDQKVILTDKVKPGALRAKLIEELTQVRRLFQEKDVSRRRLPGEIGLLLRKDFQLNNANLMKLALTITNVIKNIDQTQLAVDRFQLAGEGAKDYFEPLVRDSRFWTVWDDKTVGSEKSLSLVNVIRSESGLVDWDKFPQWERMKLAHPKLFGKTQEYLELIPYSVRHDRARVQTDRIQELAPYLGLGRFLPPELTKKIEEIPTPLWKAVSKTLKENKTPSEEFIYYPSVEALIDGALGTEKGLDYLGQSIEHILKRNAKNLPALPEDLRNTIGVHMDPTAKRPKQFTEEQWKNQRKSYRNWLLSGLMSQAKGANRDGSAQFKNKDLADAITLALNIHDHNFSPAKEAAPKAVPPAKTPPTTQEQQKEVAESHIQPKHERIPASEPLQAPPTAGEVLQKIVQSTKNQVKDTYAHMQNQVIQHDSVLDEYGRPISKLANNQDTKEKPETSKQGVSGAVTNLWKGFKHKASNLYSSFKENISKRFARFARYLNGEPEPLEDPVEAISKEKGSHQKLQVGRISSSGYLAEANACKDASTEKRQLLSQLQEVFQKRFHSELPAKSITKLCDLGEPFFRILLHFDLSIDTMLEDVQDDALKAFEETLRDPSMEAITQISALFDEAYHAFINRGGLPEFLKKQIIGQLKKDAMAAKDSQTVSKIDLDKKSQRNLAYLARIQTTQIYSEFLDEGHELGDEYEKKRFKEFYEKVYQDLENAFRKEAAYEILSEYQKAGKTQELVTRDSDPENPAKVWFVPSQFNGKGEYDKTGKFTHRGWWALLNPTWEKPIEGQHKDADVRDRNRFVIMSLVRRLKAEDGAKKHMASFVSENNGEHQENILKRAKREIGSFLDAIGFENAADTVQKTRERKTPFDKLKEEADARAIDSDRILRRLNYSVQKKGRSIAQLDGLISMAASAIENSEKSIRISRKQMNEGGYAGKGQRYPIEVRQERLDQMKKQLSEWKRLREKLAREMFKEQQQLDARAATDKEWTQKTIKRLGQLAETEQKKKQLQTEKDRFSRAVSFLKHQYAQEIKNAPAEQNKKIMEAKLRALEQVTDIKSLQNLNIDAGIHQQLAGEMERAVQFLDEYKIVEQEGQHLAGLAHQHSRGSTGKTVEERALNSLKNPALSHEVNAWKEKLHSKFGISGDQADAIIKRYIAEHDSDGERAIARQCKKTIDELREMGFSWNSKSVDFDQFNPFGKIEKSMVMKSDFDKVKLSEVKKKRMTRLLQATKECSALSINSHNLFRNAILSKFDRTGQPTMFKLNEHVAVVVTFKEGDDRPYRNGMDIPEENIEFVPLAWAEQKAQGLTDRIGRNIELAEKKDDELNGMVANSINMVIDQTQILSHLFFGGPKPEYEVKMEDNADAAWQAMYDIRALSEFGDIPVDVKGGFPKNTGEKQTVPAHNMAQRADRMYYMNLLKYKDNRKLRMYEKNQFLALQGEFIGAAALSYATGGLMGKSRVLGFLHRFLIRGGYTSYKISAMGVLINDVIVDPMFGDHSHGAPAPGSKWSGTRLQGHQTALLFMASEPLTALMARARFRIVLGANKAAKGLKGTTGAAKAAKQTLAQRGITIGIEEAYARPIAMGISSYGTEYFMGKKERAWSQAKRMALYAVPLEKLAHLGLSPGMIFGADVVYNTALDTMWFEYEDYPLMVKEALEAGGDPPDKHQAFMQHMAQGTAMTLYFARMSKMQSIPEHKYRIIKKMNDGIITRDQALAQLQRIELSKGPIGGLRDLRDGILGGLAPKHVKLPDDPVKREALFVQLVGDAFQELPTSMLHRIMNGSIADTLIRDLGGPDGPNADLVREIQKKAAEGHKIKDYIADALNIPRHRLQKILNEKMNRPSTLDPRTWFGNDFAGGRESNWTAEGGEFGWNGRKAIIESIVKDLESDDPAVQSQARADLIQMDSAKAAKELDMRDLDHKNIEKLMGHYLNPELAPSKDPTHWTERAQKLRLTPSVVREMAMQPVNEMLAWVPKSVTQAGKNLAGRIRNLRPKNRPVSPAEATRLSHFAEHYHAKEGESFDEVVQKFYDHIREQGDRTFKDHGRERLSEEEDITIRTTPPNVHYVQELLATGRLPLSAAKKIFGEEVVRRATGNPKRFDLQRLVEIATKDAPDDVKHDVVKLHEWAEKKYMQGNGKEDAQPLIALENLEGVARNMGAGYGAQGLQNILKNYDNLSTRLVNDTLITTSAKIDRGLHTLRFDGDHLDVESQHLLRNVAQVYELPWHDVEAFIREVSITAKKDGYGGRTLGESLSIFQNTTLERRKQFLQRTRLTREQLAPNLYVVEGLDTDLIDMSSPTHRRAIEMIGDSMNLDGKKFAEDFEAAQANLPRGLTVSDFTVGYREMTNMDTDGLFGDTRDVDFD